ncbi:protein LOW PSII ACCUMULATION 1, chloroplastic isoform X2 [Panicum miliaceum]|uniref:Protein LOW PSII ACCUMULATION 1, chloroplastic isoform X2 n=1 Tax=Panicum miliaceum TaxID=4540 RepID=A0A3L6QR40_PANMI|nr:protein LOW PSII ACCUMULATION 1, chloroplastic isoform X2 [Panicum miliaceum]
MGGGARGEGIYATAVALFAFLYSRGSKAKDAQVSRLAREERPSRLKLRAALRGTVRLVIVAGTGEFVAKSFRRSQPPPRGLWMTTFWSSRKNGVGEQEDDDKSAVLGARSGALGPGSTQCGAAGFPPLGGAGLQRTHFKVFVGDDDSSGSASSAPRRWPPPSAVPPSSSGSPSCPIGVRGCVRATAPAGVGASDGGARRGGGGNGSGHHIWCA